MSKIFRLATRFLQCINSEIRRATVLPRQLVRTDNMQRIQVYGRSTTWPMATRLLPDSLSE